MNEGQNRLLCLKLKMPIQGNIVAPIILEMMIFRFLGFIAIRQA
jgi:hypothetical protein